MAPRSSPQLRLFRNDFATGNAAVALRLTGTKSNRDAVGARVTVETDQGRITRIVNAGSGFLSQHSKELRLRPGQEPAHRQGDDRVAEWIGAERLGSSAQSSRLDRGRQRCDPDRAVPQGQRPHDCRRARRLHVERRRQRDRCRRSGCTSHFPRPTSRCAVSTARSTRCRRSPGGRCWSASGRRGRRRRSSDDRVSCRATRDALTAAGASVLALAVDAPEDKAKVQDRDAGPAAAGDRSLVKRSQARTTSFIATCSTGARI